jgi:signal transduction histidine kinase
MDLEFRVQDDGEIRWLYAKGEVPPDGPGEGPRLRGASVEITQRRKLEEALVGASEAVRRNIGRELHDVLSSDLAALGIQADNLACKLRQASLSSEERPADDSGLDEMIDALGKIADGVREAAKQARNLSHGLMPAALQEGHLATALEHLCREQAELGTPPPTFEGDSDEPLPHSQETAMHLYRIAREAITNAQRHAEADHIRVRLCRKEDQLALTIQDDGIGLTETESEDGGIGLRTMEHRADLIGASFSIESSPEDGTSVRCLLPLSRATGE